MSDQLSDGPRYRRVCKKCELAIRLVEWGHFTPKENMEAGEQYITEVGVNKDLKKANKGRLWNEKGAHIAQANREILQETDWNPTETWSKKR